MKKFIIALGLLAVSALSMAQSDGKVIRRIKIQSADPQLIIMILSGTANFQTPPEMSVWFGLSGFSGGGGFGGSGFGGSQGGYGAGGFNRGFGGSFGNGNSFGGNRLGN